MKKLIKNYSSLFLFFIALVCFRTAVADWNYVPSGSMEPTLFDGDWVLVDKLTYGPSVPLINVQLAEFNKPERGDIITFVPPHTDVLYVKRVVGIPGDVIRFFERDIFLNGKKLKYIQAKGGADPETGEESLNEKSHMIQYSENGQLPVSRGDFIVPEDQYFVLGDHRNNSADSRFWGFVMSNQIMGKVTHVAFSISDKRDFFDRIAIPL